MERKTELLGIVSFCVLMQNREGITDKAPSYILEKAKLMKCPFYMYSALDSSNSKKVIEWGKKWRIDFEELIKQMQDDYYEIPGNQFRKKYFEEIGVGGERW